MDYSTSAYTVCQVRFWWSAGTNRGHLICVLLFCPTYLGGDNRMENLFVIDRCYLWGRSLYYSYFNVCNRERLRKRQRGEVVGKYY